MKAKTLIIARSITLATVLTAIADYLENKKIDLFGFIGDKTETSAPETSNNETTKTDAFAVNNPSDQSSTSSETNETGNTENTETTAAAEEEFNPEAFVENASTGEGTTAVEKELLAEKEKNAKKEQTLETKTAVVTKKEQILKTEKTVGQKLDKIIEEENQKQEALTYLKKLIDEGTLYDEAMKQTQKKYPKVDIVELRKQWKNSKLSKK